MATAKIDANLQGTPTDQTKYHSMIKGLMYLTVSQPDIAFATFGLWYSKDYGFELIPYSDADLAGCLDDYKITFGGLQFLGDKLVSWSTKKQDCTAISTAEAEYISLSTCIPCSPECKIVGQILIDHPLSYALIATVDVPSVYLQHFWKTVSKVPNTKELSDLSWTHKRLVGYQGVVDKVSAFYMKFLAQPWQTMFKVFNHCLTTRTSGHDQTKINILQLFHFVVNHINVDYATLLWWDFSNYVFQKKDVIQYPRFTKLIIADLMKKFPSISPRLEEDFHSIKDDIPWICATDDYKEYEMVFIGVAVPMNQPQLGKKKKQSVRETSSPRKSLKVTIKLKPKTISIPPPSDDRERDKIAEATLLKEEIEKMVEGEEDEDSYASKFVDSMLNDDVDDFCTRLEPESHKENPNVVDDDDVVNVFEKKDDEQKDDNVVIFQEHFARCADIKDI
ncbi:hypothetical protein Tco_0913336 [Tanacetum coccineum]